MGYCDKKKRDNSCSVSSISHTLLSNVTERPTIPLRNVLLHDLAEFDLNIPQ